MPDTHVATANTKTYDPRDFYDAMWQTKPDTLGGKYLRQFWHPIALSKDLAPGKAKPIRLLSEDFTLYRGETGHVHLTVHRCPHRQTQLSVGFVEGDSIRCLYHGWKFNETGACTERPGEPGGTGAGIKIKSYPVGEFLGLIYAYIGEGEAPAFPPYAGFSEDGFIETDEQLFECSYFQSWENDWDLFHAAWTHKIGELHGPIGGPGRHAFYDMMTSTSVYTETDYGIVRRLKVPSPKGPIENASVLFMPATVRLLIPTFNEETKNLKGPNLRETYLMHTPIDDTSHYAFMTQVVPYSSISEDRDTFRAKADAAYAARKAAYPPHEAGRDVMSGKKSLVDFRNHPIFVAIEDTAAQCGQGPIVNRTLEMMGRSDAGVVYLRRLMAREFGEFAAGHGSKPWRVMEEPPEGLTTMAF